MSKLVGITLNSKFGILEAQECRFETTPDKLVTIKAGVGSGKTSLGKAINIGLSAGSERELPVDMKAYELADIDEEISYGETPVFMHTSYKDGKLSSYLYIKDESGKQCKNPVINGKRMTPAVLRDEIKTELTFGVQDFISDDPRRQMDWMMNTYKEKLREKGVVFDKKSPNYQGSILYQLDQAKLDRSQKFEKVRMLNAFKVSMESEGLREENIPDNIDISAIEKERDTFNENFYNEVAKFDAKLNEIKISSSKAISAMDAYNSSLEDKKKSEDEKNKLSVEALNRELSDKRNARTEIKSHIDFLLSKGAPVTEINKWFDSLEKIEDNKVFVPYVIHPIPQDCGKYVNDGYDYGETIKNAFESLGNNRKSYVDINSKKEEFQNHKPADTFLQKIDEAKSTNKIAARWAAWFDHQASDKLVKDLFSEYRKIFTSIDLGVEGLRIDIIGNEDDMNMRTVYNGIHNSKLFGNESGEYRAISSYSETQKNILSILMQIHLLDEKKKNGNDALRFLFIEAPMDTKTRDMLIEYQQKYDLQLLCTMTCDVDMNTLKDGEIAIENGYLISNAINGDKKES